MYVEAKHLQQRNIFANNTVDAFVRNSHFACSYQIQFGPHTHKIYLNYLFAKINCPITLTRFSLEESFHKARSNTSQTIIIFESWESLTTFQSWNKMKLNSDTFSLIYVVFAVSNLTLSYRLEVNSEQIAFGTEFRHIG